MVGWKERRREGGRKEGQKEDITLMLPYSKRFNSNQTAYISKKEKNEADAL